MSAPLADAPRVEVDDAISAVPCLTLERVRAMPVHAEIQTRYTGLRVVSRLDRAGLAKLRDACNALLGEAAKP